MFGFKQIKNIISNDVSIKELREFCILCRYYSLRCGYNKRSTNYYLGKDTKTPGIEIEKEVYFFDSGINTITWAHDLFFILIGNIFYSIYVGSNWKDISSIQIEKVAIFNSKIAFNLNSAEGIRYKTMEEKETELFSISDFIRKEKELDKLNLDYFNQQFPQIYKNLRQTLLI